LLASDPSVAHSCSDAQYVVPLEHWHWPPMHGSPVGHAFAHAPQLFTSVCRLAHARSWAQ
jgi:hypothetical protein